MRNKIIILSLLAVFVLSAGFGCKTLSKETKQAIEPITLNYWRVFDGQDVFAEVIQKYNELHPNVTIRYRKLRYEEFERELLDALAEDRGPDIFSIQNTWLRKYETKLAPLPKTITMAYQFEEGTLKKEIVTRLQTYQSLSLKDLRDNFVDVVASDVIIDDKIYGLPLAVDTLAMYYNRDLLNQAGISEVPQYWNQEFVQAVKEMTIQNMQREIVQSGVALGGADNINRASDILAALMLQSGATMMSDGGQVLFHTSARGSALSPGADALRFYSDFANPGKESYAWNEDLPNSLDMFMSGNLAIMFSYAYDLPTIRSQAPKLNFSLARLPQIEGNPPTNINIANYWVEVVSKKSEHVNEAWDFLQFIAKADNVRSYLEKSNKPTALRSLINAQRASDDLGVFASQLLTAKSWYHGKDVISAEQALAEMITLAPNYPEDKLKDLINLVAAKVQQTVY